MNTRMDDDITSRMFDIRRAIHRNPELSNAEFATSRLVRRELESAGIMNIRPVAGTGLIADVEGTRRPSRRKIAVRADLDAIPITETAPIEFASENPGVMHACGHDAHTAMSLAAALWLNRRRDTFGGVARFIFQPAEESEPLGGRTIVNEGHVDDVDGVIGIHVDPNIDVGRIGVSTGPSSLASDEFDIRFRGRAAHGGRPHEGIDAIGIACGFFQEVQKLVSRERDPNAPLVVTIGMIHGGTAHNVVAEEALVRGTIRSGNEALRQLICGRLYKLAEGIAQLHRGSAEIILRHGEPAIVNDSEMVDLIFRAGKGIVEEGAVYHAERWTACDDFAFYTERRPGVYFRLGVRNEANGCVHGLHHPEFMVDEDALPIGAAILTRAVLLGLGNDEKGELG